MTAVEHYQHQPLSRDHHYMQQLPKLVHQLARSSMCPAPWKIERGDSTEVAEQKTADLMIVGHTLADLDVRFGVTTLPQVFVVHGRPGLMAQLQITLASRHGCSIVPLDDESDATKATVKVLGKDRQWHRVTVTMEDAKTAGWPSKNPNYKTMPDRMLMARAVTKAIGQHCPEAKLLLPAANQLDLDDDGSTIDADTHDSDPPETGELVEAAVAKEELIAAYVERGSTREQAIPCAKLLWDSHGLTKGEAVPRSRLDLIVSVVKDAPARRSADETSVRDQAPDGDEPVGEPPATPPRPERVTPEVVDGPPSGEGDDPQLFAEEPPF